MGGGDDGKVIADFFIVEDAAVKFQVAFGQRLVRKGSEVPAALALHGFFDSTQVVFRQKAAVGAGVGQQLVAFVEALGKGQRILGGKAEAVVGLALQRSQIVERGRTLAALLAAFRDRRRLPAAPISDTERPSIRPIRRMRGCRI